MAIRFIDLASSPKSTLVVPWRVGGAALQFPVCPGDRFTIRNVQISDASLPGADLKEDADGMVPYLVYKPRYARLSDNPQGTRERLNSQYGNDVAPPLFRASMSTSIYCPWEGQVYVTGGAPNPPAPPLILAITVGISRNCRAEVNQRTMLTAYNIPADARIARPDFCKAISTPNPQSVQFDYGPGTFTAGPFLIDFALPVDFGPFPFCVFPGVPQPALTFWMEA